MHFLCYGVSDSAANAAADDRHTGESVHFGGMTQGADKIGDIVAFFNSVEHSGGVARGLHHNGNGALFPVISSHGNGNALTLLVQTEDDELACGGVFCHQRSFDFEQADGFSLVQKSFLYDLEHLITSYLL